MKRIDFISLVFVFLACLSFSCDEGDLKKEPADIQFEIHDVTVFNGNDGEIRLNISRGEEPFYFFWSTGDTTRDISGLYAGNYHLKIIYGKNGNSFYEGSATVSQPDPEPLKIHFVVIDSPIYGRPLGSVSISVEGGTPPYTFEWNTGETTSSIDGLFAGTYSVRVTDSGEPSRIETHASVVVGQPDFVCGRDSIMDIDQNLYPTVQIGEQCWLAENLRTIHKPDLHEGEMIEIDGRFCHGIFCEQEEGAHYTWDAMMNGSPASAAPDDKIQGICPAGWHLPTREMYSELSQWLSVDGNGGSGVFAGAKMKGAESTSGFDALFTGNWGYGIYTRAPQASFWSSTGHETDPGAARLIYVTEDTPFVNSTHRNKSFGLNVRCLKY